MQSIGIANEVYEIIKKIRDGLPSQPGKKVASWNETMMYLSALHEKNTKNKSGK